MIYFCFWWKHLASHWSESICSNEWFIFYSTLNLFWLYHFRWLFCLNFFTVKLNFAKKKKELMWFQRALKTEIESKIWKKNQVYTFSTRFKMILRRKENRLDCSWKNEWVCWCNSSSNISTIILHSTNQQQHTIECFFFRYRFICATKTIYVRKRQFTDKYAALFFCMVPVNKEVETWEQ